LDLRVPTRINAPASILGRILGGDSSAPDLSRKQMAEKIHLHHHGEVQVTFFVTNLSPPKDYTSGLGLQKRAGKIAEQGLQTPAAKSSRVGCSAVSRTVSLNATQLSWQA
jgi:hypothetical protein